MSRRKRKKRAKILRSAVAHETQRETSAADLMEGVHSGKYLVMLRPSDARNIIIESRDSGFSEDVGRDLSAERHVLGLIKFAEILTFIVGVVAAVLSLGWWSPAIVLATLIGLAIIRGRSNYIAPLRWPFILLVLAGIVAAIFSILYGAWHAAMAVAPATVWFLSRLSYALGHRYMLTLAAMDEAAFFVLFESNVLALLDTNKLQEAEKQGCSLEDYPGLLLTANPEEDHD